jgi:protein SCO1/2
VRREVIFAAHMALSLGLAMRPGYFGLDQGPDIGEAPPMRADQVPKELEGIEIEDKRGAQLPADLTFTDQDGKQVALGDYLDGKHPLVIVLAYFRCPQLCSLVISQITKGLKAIEWTAGKDFKVAIVSFDKRDDVQVAHDKRESYLSFYGRKVGEHGFDFLVGDGENAKALADVVGFHYKWDAKQQIFAHAAGAFVFTPDGRLSRTLWGLNLDRPQDVRLSLVEASQGKLGSIADRVLLYCYHWDPRAKGFVLATARLLRAAAAVTVLVLGAFLFTFWRKERRKQKAGAAS